MPSKSQSDGLWRKNGDGPGWLGGYELIRDYDKPGKLYRAFTLARIPRRGAVKKKTLYFTSHEHAKKKGWIKA